MSLILTLESAGGIAQITPSRISLAAKGRLDIGRDPGIGWTLPDPARFISGKHCEIRFRSGMFWLYDISTNGTFLNDNRARLEAPHALKHGDSFRVGHYLVRVAIDADAIVDINVGGSLSSRGLAGGGWQDLIATGRWSRDRLGTLSEAGWSEAGLSEAGNEGSR